jgi:uncharacterized protein YeaO (DUF488 family)
MMDDSVGGDPPCWAHLLGDEGRPGEPVAATGVSVRRVYDPPRPEDGRRVLVDRLWPRGLPKATARLDDWLRELAPSDALRRWYAHDPDKWPEFARRYRAELAAPEREPLLADLARRAAAEHLTLLSATRDIARSDAEVLRAVLCERLSR